MSKFSRRDFLKTTAGAAAAGTLGAGSTVFSQSALAQQAKWVPEKGAKLRVLRWKRFVQGDEDKWLENTKKFAELHKIEVRVDSEGLGGRAPEGGRGGQRRQRPRRHHLDVRGRAPVSRQARRRERRLQLPRRQVRRLVRRVQGLLHGEGQVDRRSHGLRRQRHRPPHQRGEGGGIQRVPKDTAGFLKLAQALKAKNMPAGFALGNATGDGNVWCHWLVWSHGGKMVDQKGNVVINSPETEAALNYGKQLYETFIPGTLSWLDPNNNKAFLDGQIGMTANGISVYYAAKNSQDPKIKAMADDIGHANFPVGPSAGRPSSTCSSR
jgi:multiple sugar transport system substrate-binding protein